MLIYPIPALVYFKFKCFVDPASLSCVSHSVDICTVAIKNIRNMYAFSANQIADILHFNDKFLTYSLKFPIFPIFSSREITKIRVKMSGEKIAVPELT